MELRSRGNIFNIELIINITLKIIKNFSDLRKLQRDFGIPNKIMEQCKDLGTWCNEVWYAAGCWSLEKLVWYLVNFCINYLIYI